jgi:arylsulfatase A-like enzyme
MLSRISRAVLLRARWHAQFFISPDYRRSFQKEVCVSMKTSRREFLKSSSAALSALATAAEAAKSAPVPKAPGRVARGLRVDNVILIVSDTLRRDAVSCYGEKWIQTPHLDRFAQQSLIFENSFVSSFPTVPLRNDLLTGRYTFTYKPWAPLSAGDVTLQEILSKAGILTSLVVDTPHPFAPGYNYQRGFDAWQVIRGQETDHFRSAPRNVRMPCNPGKLRLGTETVTQYLRNVALRQSEEDYFPARTMRAAADWLSENHDGRRFFLYVDTFDPHEPWDPPRYYVDYYDPGYEGEEVIYPRYDLWRDFLSEKELKHCRALYAGEVTLVDRWIGFLLDRIASLDLLKNTAVIVVADHGFYLGEHGYIGKSLLRGEYYQNLPLYPEVARIPLLIYFPGCQGGSRMRALVQPVDLMPTILDLLDVERPPSVESVSLLPLWEGRASKVQDIVVASPSLLEDREKPPTSDARSSITNGDWLLIYGAQLEKVAATTRSAAVDSRIREVRILQGEIHPELYHLSEDPACQKNLIQQNAGVATELHGAFLEFLRSKKYPESRLKYFQTL